MKQTTTNSARQRPMTRREWIGGAVAAAVITGAPAFLRGQNLNNKLDIAMIACGGRAIANSNGDGGTGRGSGAAPGGGASSPTGIPAENITVLCDINQAAVDAAAQRFPNAKKYHDYVKLRARNAPEADKFIRREYRKGWEGILNA